MASIRAKSNMYIGTMQRFMECLYLPTLTGSQHYLCMSIWHCIPFPPLPRMAEQDLLFRLRHPVRLCRGGYWICGEDLHVLQSFQLCRLCHCDGYVSQHQELGHSSAPFFPPKPLSLICFFAVWHSHHHPQPGVHLRRHLCHAEPDHHTFVPGLLPPPPQTGLSLVHSLRRHLTGPASRWWWSFQHVHRS